MSSDEIVTATLQHMTGYKGAEGFERYHRARLEELTEAELVERLRDVRAAKATAEREAESQAVHAWVAEQDIVDRGVAGLPRRER